MDTIEARPQPASAPRAPRITNACEACRAAKVKCQASTQLGICKRCLDSKRECIFKTGPRTRRPRQPKRPNPPTTSTTTSTTSPPAPPRPPPPGPSKTFTIDIPMSPEDDIADSMEALRLTHEMGIDALVPNVSEGDENDDYYDYDHDDHEMGDYDWLDQASVSGVGSVLSGASSLPVGASALSTPPSSAYQQHQGQQGQQQGQSQGEGSKGKLRTLASLRLQPQFNLDSAGKLLETFRGEMMSHFHCVVLREDETVASMAKDRPFVLLAILAAASGSSTLQGHSLYDEEFRKILGLKFVAGGERTIELLQGLVIYIAWYPFHLRPKNKQSLQYIRMVVDIISDLELDEDPGTDSTDTLATPERLEQIRLYLASYYLASAAASTWGRSSSLSYTEYTSLCSDLLSQHSALPGDHTLAWQARLERLIEETNDLRRTQRGRSPQSEYQIGLMLRGMETQLAEWEARMAPRVANTPSIRLAILFTRVFLSGAPLLKLPSVKMAPALDGSAAFRADPGRVMAVVPALHELYEFLLGLAPREFNAFIGVEWGALILAIILGFRMSFPLLVCPEWDDRAARGVVRFEEYITRFCRLGEGGGGEVGAIPPPAVPGAGVVPGAVAGQAKSMDVLSASRIVLDMVKRKFMRRLVKLEGTRKRQQQDEEKQQLEQQGQEALLAAAAAAPHPVPAPTTSGSASGRVGRGATVHDSATSGCPMMDGSLEPYYPYWDETFNNGLAATSAFVAEAQGGVQGTGAAAPPEPGSVELPDDLWTAMTMGWAQGDINFDAV
ncbi:hypothetical protein F5144DRAFT_304043 [Chaetomium tenue]|nr:hypothetical protein F5144DRAFT_304043 [Chaetomium globosum]